MAKLRVQRRTPWSVVALASIVAGALAISSVPASAGDADVYGVTGSLTPMTAQTVLGPTTTYQISAACRTVGPVSTYVDLARAESGGCSVGGSSAGTLALKGCSTGSITATNWQLTEPSSDLATFSGSGVVVGGVALVAGSPLHGPAGDGYFDPSTSNSPGSGVVVGVLAPQVGQNCVLGGVTSFAFAAVLVGEY